MYFNYHAKAKSLIKSGELEYVEIMDDYHGIKPAMVLYFLSHKPMPIRQEHWEEYYKLIQQLENEQNYKEKF
ncbi:MAG TPA: thermostable hemolysin delta-VPH [Clostridiales bacterium]|nr:thermostable hemolysin delta-VPH [Clostridiales bacterium]